MTTTATRKTAKFYRDILSGNNVTQSVSVLPEVIRKFGYKSGKNYRISVRDLTEFEPWNQEIQSFELNEKGVVFAEIYWQGDSTDGSYWERLSDILYGKVIPADNEWLGDRTYCRHSDLRITRDEVLDAIRAVAKYLSPEETKKRKEAERVAKRDADLRKRMSALCVDAKYEKYKHRWSLPEEYWNGRQAIDKLVFGDPEKFSKMDDATLGEILNKVYSKNERSNYSLERMTDKGYKEKVYDLSY